MKNNVLALSLCLFVINLQVLASNDLISKSQRCEQITLQSIGNNDPLKLIERDLIDHIWKISDEDKTVQWYSFNQNGTVQVLHEELLHIQFAEQNWSLIKVNDDVLLQLAGNEQIADQMLRIQQNCEGLLWINVLDQKVSFVDYMGVKKEEQDAIHVTGSWMQANERMTLKADGTYEMQNEVDVNKGTWQLFHRDGFIVLQSEATGQMSLLKIKHLDYSHLDVWRPSPQGPQECNEPKMELAAFEKEQHL